MPNTPQQEQYLSLIRDFTYVASQMAGGELTKAIGTANATQNLLQVGGLFSIPGIDRNMVSTHVSPAGIGSLLRAVPNNTTDPRYGIWTGYGVNVGVNPDYPCDDAPASGPFASGNLTAVFGRIQQGTNTINPIELAQKARSSSADLNLLGQIYGETNSAPPMAARALNSRVLNSAIQAEIAGVGVQTERLLSRLVYQGNPGNNSAHGGYKEFNGLDRLIITGHVDAESSIAIPAADSLIVSFNDVFDSVDKDIVVQVATMYYYLVDLATRTRMMPVTWVLAMPRGLFYELTRIWACRYLTDGCGTVEGAAHIVLNDAVAVNLRNEMYRGRYLLVNGEQLPVILDDGIVETPTLRVNSTSIYFIPLTAYGNFPATYWEYVDFTEVVADAESFGMQGAQIFWTDSGRWVWAMDHTYSCYKLKAVMEPRLILRTPHLAAKMQGITYTPSIALRSPYPDNAGWVGGGNTVR